MGLHPWREEHRLRGPARDTAGGGCGGGDGGGGREEGQGAKALGSGLGHHFVELDQEVCGVGDRFLLCVRVFKRLFTKNKRI